jgi:hypothetical protein
LKLTKTLKVFIIEGWMLGGVVLAVLLFSVLFVHGQTAPSSTDQFVVGPGEVLLPKGVFLLVRKGHEIGAIRFTSIELGAGAATGKARYESYFLADGSDSFRSSNVRKRTGNNELRPLKGIGELSFQTGNDKVSVGHWSFLSSSPGAVSMWPYRGSQKDYGYEFAPTSARDLVEIDASDKRLHWYRFDNNSRVEVPIADLPK